MSEKMFLDFYIVAGAANEFHYHVYSVTFHDIQLLRVIG